MSNRRKSVLHDRSLLTEDDIYLFNEGAHFQLYDKLGAHPVGDGDMQGTQFAVWAPNASRVSVVGDFNNWDPASHPLQARGSSGIWEGFIPDLTTGSLYKYHIRSGRRGNAVAKTDPYAFHCETPPKTASIIRGLEYEWGDEQ
jgi:1,4-alpha-glucan branching enzyme